MSRVRLVHWNAAEAAIRETSLRASGHEIVAEKQLCDVLLIDLSRLPSHGREIAVAFRAAKKTRSIPILFVEGAPEKVAAIRAQLPDAIYTTWTGIGAALKTARPVEHPVVPVQTMDRYAGRTTAQKLGIKEGCKVTLVDPPHNIEHVLGGEIEFEEDPARAAVILCFAHGPDGLPEILALGRRHAAKAKFWICWRKGKKSPVTEVYIRESAIALGLVDYKVCSLDPVWSGLLFARKTET